MYLLYYRARSHTKMYTEYRTNVVQHEELFSFTLHGAFPWTLFVFPVQEKGSGYILHVSCIAGYLVYVWGGQCKGIRGIVRIVRRKVIRRREDGQRNGGQRTSGNRTGWHCGGVSDSIKTH